MSHRFESDNSSVHAPSVQDVARILGSLKNSSVDLPSRLASQKSSTDDALLIAQTLRQSFGYGLPFSFDGFSVESNGHYYTLNTRLVNGLSSCARLSVGNYYIGKILEQPEGRHAIFYKVLRETLNCLEFLGQDDSYQHVFKLLNGLEKPKGKRDLLVRLFAQNLANCPKEKISVASILELYDAFERICEGPHNDIFLNKDSERRASILEALCSLIDQSEETGHHPIVRALAVLQMTLLLQPFSTANAFMARILFSWVLCENGFLLVGYIPIMEFLKQWPADSDEGIDSFHPRVSEKEAIIRSKSGVDWTLWFEEILDYVRNELKHFVEKLLGMSMRRERMEHLVSYDQTLNARQKSILLEALLHDDAEFTYATLTSKFDVAYATAYADLGRLESKGYLVARTKGKTTVFIADSDIRNRVHAHLRLVNPEAYARFYDESGHLTDRYKQERAHALENMLQSSPFSNRHIDYSWPSHDLSRSEVILSSFHH